MAAMATDQAVMIALESSAALAALSARLLQRARLLAEAHAASKALAQTDSATRWRKARLVWPLFTGD